MSRPLQQSRDATVPDCVVMPQTLNREQLQQRPGKGESSRVDTMYQVVPGSLATTKEKQYKELKPLICAILLGLALVVASVMSWCYYTASLKTSITFRLEQLELHREGFVIRKSPDSVSFRMGFRSASIDPESCLQGDSGNRLSCTKSNRGEVNFYVETLKPKETVTCYNIHWRAGRPGSAVEHCMFWAGAKWYGGAEMSTQHWPMRVSGAMEPAPYVTGDVYSFRGGFGGVLERYWVSSRGVAVRVNDSVPLHVGWNSSHQEAVCLQARYGEGSPFKPRQGHEPGPGKEPVAELSYQVCVGTDLKVMHRYMAKKHFKKPRNVPAESMFRYPVWSTWALYKTQVDQNKVLHYAEKIKKYKFNHSHLEIDDKYSSTYGEFDFDPVKFPNVSELMDKLESDGFKVTLWVHPFVSYNSPSFAEGVERSLFVTDPGGRLPALVEWWHGVAALLDLTKPASAEWFRSGLENLRSRYGDGYAVASFKFDAGESTYLPARFATHKHLADPSAFSKTYAEMAASFPQMCEVRVGFRSQGLPCFVRMIDRDSVWGYELGLKSLIPTALTMSLLGYHFILPDMIGGNVYPNRTDVSDSDPDLPDRELYIRWLELSAFLPAMQFSVPPWLYDSEVLAIANKFTCLRESLVAPLLLQLAEEATQTGSPIIRPLWWLAPSDPQAQSADTQFLIGDSLMVAPVVEKGTKIRDVYLPSGKWQSFKGDLYDKTPFLITEFAVNLDEVAYFTKVN
uniref:Myosis regulating glycosidase n=1 Tax=Callorhinchus milii TaxID=7868 RepID=A0A4W3IW57_CALMI|eukprot:gi/632958960/ref/XP_007895345.1/ PREDICTED: uncharacterized family 31 glucosidase KIAA1161 homolog [Callorhinchus milii]